MGNEKSLKINAVYSSQGAEKSTRETEAYRKALETLGRAARETQRAIDSLVGGMKAETKVVQDHNEALKSQVTYIQNLTAARQRAQSPMSAQWNGQTAYMNPIYSDRGAPLTTMQSGRGADWNPPQPPGSTLARFGRGMQFAGAGLGAVGAGLGIVGSLVGSYYGHEARRAQLDIMEKTTGMNNLSAAQGYRNSVFMESRSAPQSWMALRDAATYSIATDSGMQSLTGSQLRARAANMEPEQRLLEAQKGMAGAGIWTGLAKGAAGVGGVLAGGGMIAGALGLGGAGVLAGGALSATGVGAVAGLPLMAGSALGASAGTGAGLLTAGAGIAGILAGFKEVTSAIKENTAIDKKIKEKQVEAEQSGQALGANSAMNQILAIKQYQMGAFASSAGAQLSAGQSALNAGAYQTALGMSALDTGTAVGLQASLNRGFGQAGRGALGTAYRAAGSFGMNAGTAGALAGAFQTLTGDAHSLERILAAGVRQGMSSLDMGFFEKFGQAAVKAGYSGAEGQMSPMAAVGALMSGRRAPNAFQVNEKIQGLDLATSMFQDNTYLRARSMASGIGILGTNARGAEVGALAGASFTALAGKQGSEKLRLMGITDAQRQQALTERLNTLTDPMRDMLGLSPGVSSADYVRGLIKRVGSRNQKTSRAATNDLGRLAAYGSEVFGEEFGGMRGLFEAMGADRGTLRRLENMGAIGRLPGGVIPGAAAQEQAGARRLQQRDLKKGEDLSRDVQSAIKLIDTNDVDPLQLQGISALDLARLRDERTPARERGNIAQRVMQGYNEQMGARAEQQGGTYEATKELVDALKDLTKTLKARDTKPFGGAQRERLISG